MENRVTVSDLFCHIFVTLISTAIWVYMFRHRSFAFLAMAMFFPGAVAFFIHYYHGSVVLFLEVLFLKIDISIVYWSFIASALSILVVLICCGLNYLFGWTFLPSKTVLNKSVHTHNRQLLSGWLRAMGEEVGWRSYLLPGLMIHFDPIIAVNITGIVWGLYHLPIMILLCFRQQSNVHHRIRTILIQFLSCWSSSITYAWIAMKSNYSFIPPTMAHFVWNQINPRLLGSIYTNTPGWMMGEQWKINGEGLMGTMVYFFVGIILFYCNTE